MPTLPHVRINETAKALETARYYVGVGALGNFRWSKMFRGLIDFGGLREPQLARGGPPVSYIHTYVLYPELVRVEGPRVNAPQLACGALKFGCQFLVNAIRSW